MALNITGSALLRPINALNPFSDTVLVVKYCIICAVYSAEFGVPDAADLRAPDAGDVGDILSEQFASQVALRRARRLAASRVAHPLRRRQLHAPFERDHSRLQGVPRFVSRLTSTSILNKWHMHVSMLP